MTYPVPQPVSQPIEAFVVYTTFLLLGLLLASLSYGWLRRRQMIPGWLIPPGEELPVHEPERPNATASATGDDQATQHPAAHGDLAWLRDLVGALHLLVIGHTRGGKTTLIHTIAVVRAAREERVVVCDPDAAPGLWPGCEVAGAGDDFVAIGQALAGVREEIGRRRRQRGQGQRRSFAPLHLVVDEAQDVLRECAEARALIEDVLRRGGKLGIHLIIGVQDKQVRTLAIEGQGELRKNFTWVVEVRRDAQGQRWAALTSGDGEPVSHPVPPLPDLDALAQARAANHPALAQHAEVSAVPATATAYRYAGLPSDRPTDVAGVSLGQADTADTDAVSGDGVDTASAGDRITAEVIQTLYSSGWSMNRIARLLTGTQAKRLARIRTAIGEELQP